MRTRKGQALALPHSNRPCDDGTVFVVAVDGGGVVVAVAAVVVVVFWHVPDDRSAVRSFLPNRRSRIILPWIDETVRTQFTMRVCDHL